jgi:quercetin dioxygenase-like cupin family protein
MKKIFVSGGLVLAAVALVFAAEEKKSGSKSAATSEHKFITQSELQWADAPAGLPPGAKMAVLDGDPTKPGLFTVRLQSPAGYKIMPHTHPTAEHVTVISGKMHLGMGEKFDESAGHELPPGGFAVLPKKMAHFAWTTEDTVIQIHSMGPFQINYVNPADDPRKK